MLSDSIIIGLGERIERVSGDLERTRGWIGRKFEVEIGGQRNTHFPNFKQGF